MAANDYYSGFNPSRPSRNDTGPPPPPSWMKPGASNSPSPSPYTPYGDPYDHRNSQQTLASDHDYPAGMGGRVHNNHDQYADDIPLKASNPQQYHSRPDWADADTHYPPSPNAHVPLTDPEHNSRKKGFANKFFKKKIPWVTYITTVVQIAVFIAELVKSGMYICYLVVFLGFYMIYDVYSNAFSL